MPSPAAHRRLSTGASIALGALHAVSNPFLGFHARRRIQAFRRAADNVDDIQSMLLFVADICAGDRLGDALMSIAERRLPVCSRPLEHDALERSGDGVRVWLAVF